MASQPETGAVPDGQPEIGLPGPGRWRKKITEAEAIQWTGENLEAVQAFAGADNIQQRNSDALHVLTYGGWKAIWSGAWVGREDGELFCSTGKSFARNWEPVDPLAFSKAYRLITDTSGVRHLVDGAGVRYFTEIAPDLWEIAVDAATWAAWRRIAESLLATPEPPR